LPRHLAFARIPSFSPKVITWFEPAIRWKICTWSAVNLTQHAASLNSKHEPTMWSRDTGQIPCFDSCQLIITWMPNLKDVPILMVLLTYFSRFWVCVPTYGRTHEQSYDNQNFFDRWVIKFSKLWSSAREPSTRRSSATTAARLKK